MSKSAAGSHSQDETTQWVKFSLGGENYGIRVLKVQEIQRYSEISPIPGAPSYVLGIINLRGSVISVLNTREKFGLPDYEITDDSRIVILEVGKQIIGILVDSVAEVISLQASDVDIAPNVGNDETAKFIDGVSNKGGELLILLDAEKILNEDEWEDLSHL
ncbi:chemotaxis protein CheW [Pseudocolwellia sp. AS88]|uniref:chemotaxis protein CheW n=1 Tax=Pseudocolwellia sp. AS88 TaxID=3063958 RepID=UPI0026EAA05F|nr:chemotaxis protein CheW [Pseudocolwellia sp. AS88]MDO7085265.1 chemotaxis protein CheW [Pseudocolwellia sp. AS88]